ncbi:MAG: replicative DNA helicase [Firmicutes bacterium]|nr:replicative DNA helicase [Bacillota bacterium]
MADELISKKIPFSLEAEQSVLGSILISPECFDNIADMITSQDFYLEEHKQIYMAMQSLFLESKDIDPVFVADTLVRLGVYDESGGKEYLRTLAEIVPTAANVRDYAKIVRDKSRLRELISICEDIAGAAYSEAEDTDLLIDNAESRILSLSEGSMRGGFVHIKDVLLKQFNYYQSIAENPEANYSMPTGFSDVDKLLVGMSPGDLVLVGARPGMGKTAFAMNVAVNASKKTGKNVCVFSLEMSAEQLTSRLLSSEALVDSTALRKGDLSHNDWRRLAEASAVLSECNIYIDDTSGLTISAMRAKLHRMKNIGLIVLDYLQLMSSDHRVDNRVQEVADFSRNLKLIAKELNVPLICCAQLSRGPESRNDKRPMLSDLRDSGAIEQDADMVLFLYRGEYYKTTGAAEEDAEIIIAKNRHGSVGNVVVSWIGKYTKFFTKERDADTPQA